VIAFVAVFSVGVLMAVGSCVAVLPDPGGRLQRAEPRAQLRSESRAA
jgi:hypothetical protein